MCTWHVGPNNGSVDWVSKELKLGWYLVGPITNVKLKHDIMHIHI